MNLPKPLQNLKDSFEQLPGIGPKTAERLTFHLLRAPQERLDVFARAVSNLKQTKICRICKNVGEEDICEVCNDPKRDHNTICVVESPLDVLALEKSNYRGLYHVLHGAINPIAGIGPEELFIEDLLLRITRHSVLCEAKLPTKSEERIQNLHENTDSGVASLPRMTEQINNTNPINLEIILATNPDLEGEATAMFIKDKIQKLKWGDTPSGSHPYETNGSHETHIKISRIGRGLPTGADLEYADETTLKRALEGRTAA